VGNLLPIFCYQNIRIKYTAHDTTRIYFKLIIEYDHDERLGESVYEKNIYIHFKREFVIISEWRKTFFDSGKLIRNPNRNIKILITIIIILYRYLKL